ncbi:ImmA/IrrE family metallo-endopeptidase [Allomuricauda sp.]|uniref:ImmA/IrrE family metallo-endopeptidase n=1 Tax=Flagellimonas alginolytica TaxID=3177515 RepID=UPI0025E60569|nr:ImmA/IrrE family metallo-endopeptidase [Allomuricauda sp.]
MNFLFLNAIKDATKFRHKFGLNMFEPVNIYDICRETGVMVKIVNINMEGIYVKADTHNKPTILLSNERPMPRRVFTCAHEYGHHFYGHSSKIDSHDYIKKYTVEQNQEELLVNTFAGALLMPISGVQSQFAKRRLNPNKITPVDFYGLSSYFGVGYQTLIYHCKVNNIISFENSKDLLRYTPSKILKKIAQKNIENSHFKYIDNISQPSVVDLEVNNYIILPVDSDTSINMDYFEEIRLTDKGKIYKAIKSGISILESENFKQSIKIRIERENYIGLSKYRHLE